METVKDFIEKISANEFYGNNVKVFTGKDRDAFINNYLVKSEIVYLISILST